MENTGRNFNVYAVKDELTGRLLQPIFMESDPEAIRWFKYTLNTTDFWKVNASMYSLYRLAEYNEVTGFKEYPIMEMIQGGLAVKED